MYLPAPHRSSNSWLSSSTTGTQYYILHVSQQPEFKSYVYSLTQSVFFFSWRSQRLQFDVSSPNGILLFRETSKMITTYGTNSPIIIQFSYFNQLFLWYVVALLHLNNLNWIIIVISIYIFFHFKAIGSWLWVRCQKIRCTRWNWRESPFVSPCWKPY